MGGVRERRQRQQGAIDRGEPLRTKKGKIKKGNEKGFRPNSGRHIGERVGKALLDPSNTIRRGAQRAGVGKKDSATIGRGAGYVYDVGTFGVAPVANLISDEVRSRKKKKKDKKKKNK